MEKNEIAIIYGTDYQRMTRDLLASCDLASLIGDRRKRIGIKPNLVAAIPAEEGATTHPEMVAGLIGYLQDAGFSDIRILEGSWVGDKTSEAFEVCGYERLSRETGVPLIDMQRERPRACDCGGMEIRVGEAAFDLDFLIGCPVMKGHCQTRVTCALKNLKGLLPNTEKRHFHAMGLHKPIAHLSVGIRQDFILVDDICPDLDFEDGGSPVEQNRIMAGRDPVLMDAYACRLMHVEPWEVPYLTMAEKLGAGSTDLGKARIHVLGEDLGKELVRRDKVVAVLDVVEEVESCSACYGYLIPALAALREEMGGRSLLVALGGRICIGQGYRGKSGAIGVGTCTRGFEKNLPGCPPMPEEIERFLREIIREREDASFRQDGEERTFREEPAFARGRSACELQGTDPDRIGEEEAMFLEEAVDGTEE